MRLLDLEMIDDQTVIDAMSNVIGNTDAATQLRQLMSLIRSKIDQTRSYYQVAVTKADSEQQRDLLIRRTNRTQQLVQRHQDAIAVNEYAEAALDSKIRRHANIAFQYLMREVRAYEYLSLATYDGLSQHTPDLVTGFPKMSTTEYWQNIKDAHRELDTANDARIISDNVQGNSQTAGTTFLLRDMPTVREKFLQTGEITLSIPLPERSNYFGVTFSDVRAYLVGYQPLGDTDAVLHLRKGGTSTFKNSGGKTLQFTHALEYEYGFRYEASRCESLSTSDPRLRSAGDRGDDVYARLSPYGTWTLTIDRIGDMHSMQEISDAEALAMVTAIRFEFRLNLKDGDFEGARMMFDDHEHTGELGSEACASDEPCNTMAEFVSHSQHATRECCGDPTAPCVDGMPTVCSAACAGVVLSMRDQCGAFVDTFQGLVGPHSLRTTIDEAAELCAPSPPPPPDCSLPGLMQLIDSGVEEACPGPDNCSEECEASFGGFASQCYTWAQAEPDMQDVVPLMRLCQQRQRSSAATRCERLVAELESPAAVAAESGSDTDWSTICCGGGQCDENGVPALECNQECAELLVPLFAECSEWIRQVEHSLAPAIELCEDTLYGAYTGSVFSPRCSRAEKGTFLGSQLPEVCCGQNLQDCPSGRFSAPFPKQCSAECAAVFDTFYAECHPSFEGTQQMQDYSSFLRQCQGLGSICEDSTDDVFTPIKNACGDADATYQPDSDNYVTLELPVGGHIFRASSARDGGWQGGGYWEVQTADGRTIGGGPDRGLVARNPTFSLFYVPVSAAGTTVTLNIHAGTNPDDMAWDIDPRPDETGHTCAYSGPHSGAITMDCETTVSVVGQCDFDLSTWPGSSHSPMTLLRDLCPASCGDCPEEAPAVSGGAQGEVRKANPYTLTCMQLARYPFVHHLA
jgi:hypothetical protein